MANAQEQELLEPADVGRILGLGPQRVSQLAEAGQIPVFGRTPRGVRLFKASDIQRVLAARAQRRAALEGDAQRRGAGTPPPTRS